MRKPRISLRTGMSTVIVLCWLAPILLLVTVFGFLIGQSYQRSARQELDDNAQFALLQIQSELESAVSDSKSVSYDGVIRSAYRSYRESRNKIALYRSANEYLRDNFSRSRGYRAVFLVFWEEEINANAYAFCDGESGSALIRDCQEATPVILDAMREEDTQLCFLLIGSQLYLTRNLLDSHFEPYATIVVMLRPSALFAPLSPLGEREALQLQLDALCFGYDGEEGVEPRQEEDGYLYETEIEGHRLCLRVAGKEYNVWRENPSLNWAAGGAALLVLPLLVLLWLLWRRHVSRPVETLVEANMKVQSGERGYEITQHAPNTEFETLFEHFNDMSAEMKAQFERSYLEQQASQRAQIKALQSQINPHFLNNTLEVINWEARLAGNDRVGAMIEALSTMLDAALDRDGRTQIPLREELGYVDAYLYIIRERLGEGFHVHKEIDESLLQRQVPRLILQPIVENAVEHDMTRNGGGELWLRVYRQERMLVLEVEHEGSMTEADREKVAGQLRSTSEISGSVGIQNVNQRLKLIYGEDGSLSLDETGRGTILARICFPLAEEGE